MQKLRRYLNESFFNPLFHFIPLISFLVIEDLWGLKLALSLVYPLVAIVLLYSYVVYSNIYKYLGVSYLVSTVVIAIIVFFPFQYIPPSVQPIVDELIVFFAFMAILLLSKYIKVFVIKKTIHTLAMTNNVHEHFRIVWIVTGILFLYTHGYMFTILFFDANKQLLTLNKELFYLLLAAITIYELIRVSIVRRGLSKEEWWPILNEQGAVKGSIQCYESLLGNVKYIHPITRIVVIEKGKIMLNKVENTHNNTSFTWEISAVNHVKMNETIEKNIENTSMTLSGIADFKPLFYSKYKIENEQEIQFVYLFVVCKFTHSQVPTAQMDKVKWWTIQQIQDNLNTGIFSGNFEHEFELLKRGGLLDSDVCDCSCRLKEVILSQTTHN
ncbi:MAG: hypothetical protein AUK44_00175 [Porphyromonadaceae bacterium CG2_30_38_12]|nr:MAG: hypothetical protein AUK44_00175 [Porphyromonadaceae bacterium CG2_30_38_12]